MELRQMLYVIRVADERSFSKAATSLHLAQPSLSQQILKLEKELGVTLFDRAMSPIRLTDAGERFLEKARKVLDLTEQMQKEMQDISHAKKGRLLIGTMPMTGAYVLPRWLPSFQQAHPDIELTMLEETSSNLETLTLNGATDISVLQLPLSDELDWIPLMEEEIYLALPPENPLAQSSRLRLDEAKDEPFILMKPGQGLRNMALELCSEAGFTPNIVLESSNIETIQSFVASGLGVAFVPKYVARTTRSAGLPHYAALEPKAQRTIVLAYRKGAYISHAVKAFMEWIESHSLQMTEEE
jgi:LysR family hydrogen peroxide-inducible transcriptional activator